MSNNRHKLHLFCGSANPKLAEEVADHLKINLGKCTTQVLPDSEIHVMIDELVRNDDVYIIQPCPAPVNDNLMELLLYVDAFRRASAHAINVVIPYFPYARQERMAKGREAISARVVATMLETMGATRVIYVDIHAEATQGFFTIPVDPLSALPVFAEYFSKLKIENPVIIAPDVGRAKIAGRFAQLLDLEMGLMHKRRISPTQVEVVAIGDIRDKTPIVFDDLIAGGSVLEQVEELIDAGARPEVYMAVTHPVLLDSAIERLTKADYIKQLVVTNTVAIPAARQHEKIKVLSIAPLLADVIGRIYHGKTVGPLLKHLG